MVHKRNITTLSADVLTAFINYDWPGNVRELRNLMEGIYVLCRQSIITADNIPEEFFMENNFHHGKYRDTSLIISLLFHQSKQEIWEVSLYFIIFINYNFHPIRDRLP